MAYAPAPPTPPTPVTRYYHVVDIAGDVILDTPEWITEAPEVGSYLWINERGYPVLRVNNCALNMGYIEVGPAIRWFKWNGEYEKQSYDVWISGCDVVLGCWPNAGKMCATDGSGREWTKDQLLAVRVSEYQGRYPHPFEKS